MTRCYDRGMRRLGPLLPCGLAGPAPAPPPQVEIRAQTKLALDNVHLGSDGRADIRGQLLDGLTGEGIGGQVVVIKIGGKPATATPRPDGKFHTALTVDPGPQPIEIRFRGAALLNSSQLTQVTDPARA